MLQIMALLVGKKGHFVIDLFSLSRRSLLTHCILGNFSCFFCRLLIFFKVNFLKKIFQEYDQNVKQFGP